MQSVLNNERRPIFVDVFAGCGGLSLGLMRAGWQGLFAIERDENAFATLSKNLLSKFAWPEWLPQQAHCINGTLDTYGEELVTLAGTIDILVGGPPCQGYSRAGKRDLNDPRNQLFASYLKFVNLIKPKIVLIENVRGMTDDFDGKGDSGEKVNYANKLVEELSVDYWVFNKILDLSAFGLPQRRFRFFIIGFSKNHYESLNKIVEPFSLISDSIGKFLRSKGLTGKQSVKSAISDLEVGRNGMVDSSNFPGFKEIAYVGPITPYQILMRDGFEGMPSDTRLANHKPHIKTRFSDLIKLCREEGRLNVSLRKEVRESYGLKKQAIRVLDPDLAAPTITSMPDDLIHYSEPRALTVRENARIQSFPDWFEFCGKYTTGGARRKKEVPRFTQVANAVPPLAAEAIGAVLFKYLPFH